MMQLFLEAVDVWLFRDGKPFDAKSDHRARSLFPPYPSVMQGVIRSHHLVESKKVDFSWPKDELQARIKELVGDDRDFKGLNLRGPFIVKREKDGSMVRYFPVPADVAPREEGYRSLRPRSLPKDVKVSAPDDLPMLLWPEKEDKPTKKEHGQWLDEKTLIKCLGDPEATVAGAKSGELFVAENRFGIGRNDATRTTEEGALYEVEFIGPCKDVGLWVQVEGYDGWPTSGVLRIGGEGRGAHFAKVEPPLTGPPVPDPLPLRFKVYFATPTYFSGGWRPNEGWSKFFDGGVTLQAVALNRYDSIGGYDWAAKPDKAQKPARRYVPAGSVYYFSRDGSAKLKQDTITDAGAEIGFGQIIITEWKER